MPDVTCTSDALVSVTSDVAQTEIWWGYADSSLGWLRCNNVLADADVQQRAIPDEEALALR